MIRPAIVSDLSKLEAMGAEFFKASGLEQWFDFKPRCFSQVCANFMASDKAVVLVGEGKSSVVAMAAAWTIPCWFNDTHLICQELFWWVEPLQRGGSLAAELRRGIEEWARERGCHTIEMSAMEASKPEALARLYERQGYGPKERNFCKTLRS